MLGNILGNTPSERRPNAEFVQAVRTRWADVFEAVDLEHLAERRVYPNMFVVPKPVEAAVMPTAEAPVLSTVKVPIEVVSNVINLDGRREVRVTDEQERRLAAARLAAKEARYAAA